MTTETTNGAAAAPAAPLPGTPEHDAAMVKVFESKTGIKDSTTSTSAKSEKPADVPDKFWSAETGKVDFANWSKSTQEAERRITELSTAQKSAQDAAAKEDERVKTEAEAKVKAHTDSKTVLEKKVSDLKAANASAEEQKKAQDELEAHVKNAPKAPEQTPHPSITPKLAEEFRKSYAENGKKVTEEFYKKFSDVGIDREMVDGYIAGQAARGEQLSNNILGTAKMTREEFNSIAQWAGANSTAEEIAAINKAIQSAEQGGSHESAALALSGLKAKFIAANGQEPKLMGGNASLSGKAGFTSLSEQKAAQKDPRYNKDESYRADVERRIAASTGY